MIELELVGLAFIVEYTTNHIARLQVADYSGKVSDGICVLREILEMSSWRIWLKLNATENVKWS